MYRTEYIEEVNETLSNSSGHKKIVQSFDHV